MVTEDKASLATGLSRTQDKDFPYFRRLWNSVVVALLAASFIPLLVIGGGMYYYTVSLSERKMMDSLGVEIVAHRKAIDAFLAERTMDLKLISSNLGLDYLTSPGALEKVFHSLQRELPCFTDLGIIDDQGRHLAYVGPYDLLSKNYRETPWFKVVAERDVYVSDAFLGFRREPHFIIAVKQRTDQGYWIIRATVDTDYFDRMVAEVLSQRSGDAFVVNKEGVFQTSPRTAGRLMEKWAFKDLEPFEEVRVEEEKGEIFLMTWLEKAPWLCVAKFNRHEIYRPLRNIRNLGISIFGVAAIIIVLTVFLTTNYLFGRLESKRRNIRFLDQQLRHSSKMASSMKLASGFIRDINDALSNIDTVVTWVGDLAHKDLSIEG
ncbi:MAG: cache domain-containing protein, partial [Desulfobacterales bacterium]|nr:cache domain-containing protein [Desulfobacterales bacterium]